VSSVTINGKTFAGSTGFSNTSGGSPAGYYDYTYTKDTVPRIKAGQSISISYLFQELKRDKVFQYHTQVLLMVTTWSILNYGLTLMVMVF